MYSVQLQQHALIHRDCLLGSLYLVTELSPRLPDTVWPVLRPPTCKFQYTGLECSLTNPVSMLVLFTHKHHIVVIHVPVKTGSFSSAIIFLIAGQQQKLIHGSECLTCEVTLRQFLNEISRIMCKTLKNSFDCKSQGFTSLYMVLFIFLL
jgi:hypothetical protein